ncbi:hypothetical protein Godav_000800 [Gossypium davidsonii]|uniref:Uncharacterized protein n=1 Tax=Gossypium davidsonii TaxID=34287 RepID=A0A7J8T0S4_GOSDV|nr:hypothetical protein [Gossypium davidsonii]
MKHVQSVHSKLFPNLVLFVFLVILSSKMFGYFWVAGLWMPRSLPHWKCYCSHIAIGFLRFLFVFEG